MTTEHQVPIYSHNNNGYVQATLIENVDGKEIAETQKAWKDNMDSILNRLEKEGVAPDKRPQHAHWDWEKKHKVTNPFLIYQILGIRFEGRIQGLMLIQTANVFCEISEQAGKGLVYIRFIATAPWNSIYATDPIYGQVGPVLLNAAISVSIDLGFKGRVGLHAIKQSETWYEKNNMTDLGIDPDPKKENMRYFEITPAQAEDILK